VDALYADAHVHLYPCFDFPALVRTALARARALSGPLLLLLCESHGLHAFARLREGGSARALGSVRVRETAEPQSLALEEEGAAPAPPLYLVAGRQIVSREGIEVLALGLAPNHPLEKLPDRARPAEQLLGESLAAGALCVLPWGIGKWIGARGRSVAALAQEPHFARHPRFFLGDIAQRAFPWPEPALFREHRVLSGTDPLPVPGAERRVARYGTRAAGRLAHEAPARSFLEALDGGARLARFGRRETLGETLREQLAHRARRRASRSAHSGPCATIC
jgi:hypothetical protein